MKYTVKILMALLLIALTGSSRLQAVTKQPTSPIPALEPASAALSAALTPEEYAAQAVQAHHTAVKIFSEAFEAELTNGDKLPWSAVRPQLLQYWSEELVDTELKEFYANHLWDWGYEMGFAFPLWQPESIEDVQITVQSANVIIGRIKVPTDYETVEYLPITLENNNGSWVIASPFMTEYACKLI